jgi:hypothetical protein
MKVGNRILTAPAALAFVVLLLISPAAAMAKTSPGVHVDPGSPAAKEYSVPLGSARHNGTPSDTSSGGKLFGSGITKSTTTPAPAPAPTPVTTPPATTTATPAVATTHHKSKRKLTHAKARRRSHSHHPAAVAVKPPPTRPSAPSPARAIGTSSGSDTGLTWMIVAAVIVLLLGGIGAAAVTRRGRRTSPYPN